MFTTGKTRKAIGLSEMTSSEGMCSLERGDEYGSKKLQWQNMMLNIKWPTEDTEESAKFFCKNQDGFLEEEVFELRCKLDHLRGK